MVGALRSSHPQQETRKRPWSFLLLKVLRRISSIYESRYFTPSQVIHFKLLGPINRISPVIVTVIQAQKEALRYKQCFTRVGEIIIRGNCNLTSVECPRTYRTKNDVTSLWALFNTLSDHLWAFLYHHFWYHGDDKKRVINKITAGILSLAVSHRLSHPLKSKRTHFSCTSLRVGIWFVWQWAFSLRTLQSSRIGK